jgi:lipopolysaccharide export system protein LptC
VIRFLRRAWDRLTIYLPIILMGLLAMGSYWLVRSTPVAAPVHPAAPPTHEFDYRMNDFSVKTYDVTGRLKNEIHGNEARHYPDTDTLEIDQFRALNFNEKGHMTTATANSAVLNSDASEVQLLGNAVVVREAVTDKAGERTPRMSFRSEFLHAYMETERVKSHKPVELTRGNDQFTADSMDFDNFEQVMQLHGRVRGTLAPNPAR